MGFNRSEADLMARIASMEMKLRRVTVVTEAAEPSTYGCTNGCTGSCPDPTDGCTHGCTYSCTNGCTDACTQFQDVTKEEQSYG